MSQRPTAVAQRVPPRLYLVTPAIEEAAAIADDLAAALGATDIAAVLLRLAPAGEREMIKHTKALAPIVQNSGAALVLDGHPDIAVIAGADGAHLTGIEAFEDAVQRLKPEWIAGAGGLQTRHDAMIAAEHGADYVMFGEPDENGERPSLAAIAERVAWWAEVFEVPCVAFAASLDEIGPLAAAGADFIALADNVWRNEHGAGTAAAKHLASAEPVG